MVNGSCMRDRDGLRSGESRRVRRISTGLREKENKRMNLPRFRSYGEYSSSNYGAHCLVFSVGELDIYFSYKTPVAFRAPGYGLVVSANCWGRTTGKHLNWIDDGDKKNRIPRTEFELLLQEASEKVSA